MSHLLQIGHAEWNSFSHFLWRRGLEKTKPSEGNCSAAHRGSILHPSSFSCSEALILAETQSLLVQTQLPFPLLLAQNHHWREAYSEQLLDLLLGTPIWTR